MAVSNRKDAFNFNSFLPLLCLLTEHTGTVCYHSSDVISGFPRESVEVESGTGTTGTPVQLMYC
jgi:hypothetical protein